MEPMWQKSHRLRGGLDPIDQIDLFDATSAVPSYFSLINYNFDFELFILTLICPI